MRYIATNELAHFQFHDAEIKDIVFCNEHMIWEIDAVNASAMNTQNKFDKEMCIENAQITFENTRIESIIFNGYKSYDHNNNLIESKEASIANPSEYDDILKETLKGFCYVFSMEELSAPEAHRYRTCFNIDGGAGMFYLTIEFTKSIVRWNEFCGEAWYEDEKWKTQM